MNEKGKRFAIAGTALQAGSGICFLLSASAYVGMIVVVGMMWSTKSGEAPSESFLYFIGCIWAFFASATFILSGIAAVFLFISFLGFRYRSLWFRKVLWVSAIYWLPFFLIGTVLSLTLIVCLVNRNKEFTEQSLGGDSGRTAADGGPTGAPQG